MNPRTNALCEILVDDELVKYISKKGLTLNSIPPKGEKVYLRPNSNVAMGGICEDYTDRVHPSVIEINTVPGIHMHFRPAIGKSRNIAKYIVDMIYPETFDIKEVELDEESIKRL